MVVASRLDFDDLPWFAARPRAAAAWLDIYRLELESFAGRLRELAALLAASERDGIRRLRSPDDRRRTTIARGAALHILGAYLRVPAEAVPLRRDRRGRPYLAVNGGAPCLHVSTARAGAVSALAVSGAGPVGIDVETVADRRFSERVVPVMLSTPERAALSDVARRQRPNWLARTWVRKEALLKADGSGLSLDPATIDAAPVACSASAEEPAFAWEAARVPGWSLREMAMAEPWVGAVAVCGAPPVLTTTELVADR